MRKMQIEYANRDLHAVMASRQAMTITTMAPRRSTSVVIVLLCVLSVLQPAQQRRALVVALEAHVVQPLVFGLNVYGVSSAYVVLVCRVPPRQEQSDDSCHAYTLHA